MVSIAVVLVLGAVVSVVVGRLLRRAGRPFLDDVFVDDRVSDAVAHLLAVLFYLVSLGVVALVAVLELPGVPWLYATSMKLGTVLLVLGATHGLVLLILLRIRKRRRHQLLEEGLAEQMSQRRPGRGITG